MGRLLDKYASQLPGLQARQIERELTRSREGGELRTTQDFRAAFQTKLKELLSAESPLRFSAKELFENSKRSSELVSSLLSWLGDDLESLFTEYDKLLGAAHIQQQLFKEEVLSRIQSAITEADLELQRIEFLYGNTEGFTDAIVENFRSSASRLERTHPIADRVYKDPKLGVSIHPDQDMSISSTVSGLCLPLKSEASVVFSAIKDQQSSDVRSLADSFAIPFSITPSTPSDQISIVGRIENLIDRRLNTFWQKTISVNSRLDSGAKLNLVVSTGASQEFNYLEVQPFGPEKLELSELYSISSTGLINQIELASGPVTIAGPTRVVFDSVVAIKFMLVFTQKTPTTIILDGTTGAGATYTFALDNILAGKLAYQDRGYFVTKTLHAPQISRVMLRSKENLGLTALLENQIELGADLLPLVEYWVHLREYDAQDSLVFSSFLPIASAEKTRLRELAYRASGDQLRLNFMVFSDPDNESLEYEPLNLYRERTLLARPLDYTLSEELLASSPQKCQLTTLDVHNSSNTELEYIADYVPLHLTAQAPSPFTDPSGLIRYNRDGSITIERPSSSRAIRSELNLVIIMRALRGGTHSSTVNEITLGVG